MSFGDTVLFAVTLIVMLGGIIGCLLPAVPGIPVIWISALVYALITGFERIGTDYLVTFGILSVATLLLDYIAGVYGAKRFGASKWGMLGAFLGMIVGLIIGFLPGMILGPFIGAVALELIAGKQSGPALKAGFGTFIGFLCGTFLKLVIGTAMIGVFIHDVFWTVW